MVRLTKDQARKLIKNKLPVCKYCKNVYKTDKELKEHLKEVHGKYKVTKRKKRGGKRTQTPFDPKVVYNYWLKNKSKWKKIGDKNPFNKRDIRDLVIKGKIDIWNILYIWDMKKKVYRIYMDDYILPRWTEIVYNPKSLQFTIKNFKKLKKTLENP